MDRNGVVSIALGVLATKPDVTILLSSFAGLPDKGRSKGTLSYYGMGAEDYREAAEKFIELSLSRLRTEANDIDFIGYDLDGSQKKLHTAVAGDVSDPKALARQIVHNIEFPRADFNDSRIETLAQKLFPPDPKRNSRQLIVFGRSGFAHNVDYCASFDTAVHAGPNSKGDGVALVDFASSHNKATDQRIDGGGQVSSSESYPAWDCRVQQHLHWVFFPQDKKARYLNAMHELFDRFIQQAVERSKGAAQ